MDQATSGGAAGRQAQRRAETVIGPLVIVGATLATAVAGGLTADFRSAWYQALEKPSWQPSGRVIGSVWTILYPLIALAGVLLWRTPGGRRDRGLLALFCLQWVLNFLFTPLLTRVRSPALAALDCGALAAAVWLLVGKAIPVRRPAGLLLVPYGLWTTFATALSLALLRRNASASARTPHVRR
jgi:translocator protein